MTCLLCPKFTTKNSGRFFQKNWEGACSTPLETLTLFQTKICDFPYPISDLIKNLIPYFRPEALEPGACDKLLRHVHGSWRNAPINVMPAGGQGMWWGFDCLCWPFVSLILFSQGRGYLNLSSPNVEIFDCRLGQKRLRPKKCFPLPRFTHAPYGLRIWKS